MHNSRNFVKKSLMKIAFGACVISQVSYGATGTGKPSGTGNKSSDTNTFVELKVNYHNSKSHVYSGKSYGDCKSHLTESQRDQSDSVLSNLKSGKYSGLSDVSTDVTSVTEGWSLDAKACLLARINLVFEDHYNKDVTYQNISPNEVVERLNNGDDVGVCAQDHATIAYLGNQMGLSCGTFSNTWETKGKTTGHVAAACWDSATKQGSILNWGHVFTVDAQNFRELLDEGNWILSPLSVNGQSSGCINADGKTAKHCNHIYLAKDTQYGLGIIGDAALSESNKPISVTISNQTTGVTGNYGIQSSSVTKKGNYVTRKLNIFGVANNHLPTDYSIFAAGLAGRFTLKGLKGSELAASSWVGIAHADHPNFVEGLYSNGDTVQTTGIYAYLDIKGRLVISKNLSATGQVSGYFEKALNGKGIGGIDQVTTGITYDLPDTHINGGTGKQSVSLSHTASFTGSSANNQVLWAPQMTKLSYLYAQKGEKFNLDVDASVLVLHGTYQTLAFVLTPEMEIALTKNLDLYMSQDLTYTFARPEDAFLADRGFWGKSEVGINYQTKSNDSPNGTKKGKLDAGVKLYAGMRSSGDKPSDLSSDILLGDGSDLNPGTVEEGGLYGGLTLTIRGF